MEMQFSGNPKPFGIIGLVVAILSMLFSFIPCVGFYAVIPSLISIIFCLMAFLYLRQNNQKTTVPLAGLIIGTIALSVGIFQYINYKSVFDEKDELENMFNKAIQQKVIDELQKGLDSVSNNDSIQQYHKDSTLQ